MHSLKQSLTAEVTVPRLIKHPILKVDGLLFLLFYSDIFYDADAMTSIRSMTRDQSSSHRDTPALNTMMQQQAASHWSNEGLQNQSQRSVVMSLDTMLSQQNKASIVCVSLCEPCRKIDGLQWKLAPSSKQNAANN